MKGEVHQKTILDPNLKLYLNFTFKFNVIL